MQKQMTRTTEEKPVEEEEVTATPQTHREEILAETDDLLERINDELEQEIKQAGSLQIVLLDLCGCL
jgi:hypothetical protein